MARAHKEVRFTFTTLGGSTGDVNTGKSTSGCCLNPTEASAPKISAVSCGKSRAHRRRDDVSVHERFSGRAEARSSLRCAAVRHSS